MRLSAKEFEDLVKEVAGNDTVRLVPMLWNKKNVSEFKMAEQLRLTVNMVRNMLYRLHEHNLVVSTRKKDKKKGWYIYYWTLNSSNARTLLFNVKHRRLSHLKHQLEYEKAAEILYTCPHNCNRLQVQDAIEQGFKCTECGRVLQEEQNGHAIQSMQQEIEDLEKQLQDRLSALPPAGHLPQKSLLQPKPKLTSPLIAPSRLSLKRKAMAVKIRSSRKAKTRPARVRRARHPIKKKPVKARRR